MTRRYQDRIKDLNADLDWTMRERLDNRCPATACGHYAGYCAGRSGRRGYAALIADWICYCEALICRSRGDCRSIDKMMCEQRRVCESFTGECPESKSCG